MEEYRGLITLIVTGLYMAMCVGVGLWALRRTRSPKDFFMAGRDLGICLTAFAVFSSIMSGFGFVGGPGLVYSTGMSSVWMVVSASIGLAMSFFLLGKRIRLFAELRDSVSLPDVVAARYRSESSRLLTAVAIVLGVLGYLAAQVLAMARVLQDIIGREIGAVSLEVCAIASCAVLVFYCVTGGIVASVYTDLVQGMVMVVAAVLIFFAARGAVEGGFAGMAETILRDDPEAASPWGTLGVFASLSWYFLFALGGMGQPHVVTKLMMNRRIRDARHILPVSFIGYLLSALLWISVGLVMRTLVLEGLHPEPVKADAAASQFLQSYAHPLLAGVVFAGLFAAIMSTADSFLNIGAAAIVHDIPTAIRGCSLKRELFWARTTTVILAAVATLIAVSSESLVALLGAFGWGTFAAALVPTVAVGFNWKRATPLAANVAIIASLVVNFGIELLSRFAGIRLAHAISPGAVALLVSLTLFFGISLLSPPPKLDPDIETVMDI